jgi:hypothetical protein
MKEGRHREVCGRPTETANSVYFVDFFRGRKAEGGKKILELIGV